MNILKYCILFLIFGTSSGIGILISKKYTNRVLELKELKCALNTLKTKIKFTYAPLPEIFKEMSQNLEYRIGEIFYISSQKMKNMSAQNAWNETINEVDLNLIEEDKNILKNFGKLLRKNRYRRTNK